MKMLVLAGLISKHGTACMTNVPFPFLFFIWKSKTVVKMANLDSLKIAEKFRKISYCT